MQRTVWIDAGSGDDRVEILSGSTMLPDQSERPHRNDAPENAFDLTAHDGNSKLTASRTFSGLTIDNPADVDFYRFTVGADLTGISLRSNSQDDGLMMALLRADSLDPVGDAATTPFLFVPDKLDANGNSNDSPDKAYVISGIEGVGVVRGLTLHQQGNVHRSDVDWFEFELPDWPDEAVARVTLKRLEGGEISLGLYDADARQLRPATTDGEDTLQLDMSDCQRGTYLLKVVGDEPARYELHFSIVTAGHTLLDFAGEGQVELGVPDKLEAGAYLLRISSTNLVPTVYDVTFQIREDPATTVDLSAREEALRRDIILGGRATTFWRVVLPKTGSSAAWVTTC